MLYPFSAVCPGTKHQQLSTAGQALVLQEPGIATPIQKALSPGAGAGFSLDSFLGCWIFRLKTKKYWVSQDKPVPPPTKEN